MGRRADSLFLRVEEHLEPSGMEKVTHCLPASDPPGAALRHTPSIVLTKHYIK